MERTPKFNVLIDDTTTPNVTYICKADLGRGTDQPFWQIQAIDESSGSVEIKYPLKDWFPSDKFEFIADDRATTLTYSFIAS